MLKMAWKTPLRFIAQLRVRWVLTLWNSHVL
jgi:hypothetical protein